MKNIVILGAGGFGREVHAWLLHHAEACGEVNIKGFLDDNAEALSGIEGMPSVIGGMRDYDLVSDDLLLCALGSPRAKLEIYEYWKSHGASFMTLIHPTAVVGQRVVIGEGSVLCPGVIVTSDISIGKMVTLNAAATVGHDVVIGDGCTLSGHADVTGYARLKRGSFLGSHAVVAPKACVGENAVVGAGSVVIRNVPDGATVFGVPAKQITGFQD